MENNQPVTEKDENADKFAREKQGLISDLAEQRKKNRALEERINLIESSLNAPEPEPALPVDARVQKFAEDPDDYIRNIAKTLVREEVEPLRRVLSQSQIDSKLSNAMEIIAEKEGITKREAAKKYEKPLADVVESRGFGNLDPLEGTLTAYDILKATEKESAEMERQRDRTISGNHTETVRETNSSSKRIWKTSDIAKLTRGPGGEFDKNRDEILRQQREGILIRDT